MNNKFSDSSLYIANVHTNIVYIDVNPQKLTAKQFSERLLTVTADELADLGREECSVVKMDPTGPSRLRFVTHPDVDEQQVAIVAQKLKYVIAEIDRK